MRHNIGVSFLIARFLIPVPIITIYLAADYYYFFKAPLDAMSRYISLLENQQKLPP